jgi:hypothetical protein
MAGGTDHATPVILRTTSGDYRRALVTVLREHKRKGLHLTKSGKLLGFTLGPLSKGRIRVVACEDYSASDWVDSRGRVAIDGARERYVQTARAIEGEDGFWRIDQAETRVVTNFATESCNQGGI